MTADLRKPAVWNRAPVDNVRRIVAVASGKGGVGKSTVAAGLAQALARSGRRVGLLDADIYGPSVPTLMKLSGKPALADGKMVPPVSYGVQCMSMGFLIGDEAAILRGPMITKTLTQLLRGTRWGEEGKPLDMLIIDMPPGTGDIHLSMAQSAPLDGAIAVTLPQALSVVDAAKAIKMFEKLGVPVLGVVENMSGEIFGRGGGRALAEKAGVPFLGEIPLDAALRKAGDAGEQLPGDVFEKLAVEVSSKIS